MRTLLLASILSFSALAQSPTAALSGVVVDPSEEVLSAATVRLTDVRRGLVRSAASDADGQFSFGDVPPAVYALRVERSGFTPAEQTGLVLTVGERRTLRLRLEVASRADAVTVIAESPLIDESPSVSTVIDGRFIEHQPLNGRSFQSLIELSPGVVLTPANLVVPGQFSVNGQRATSNYFTVDGVSANMGTTASVTPYEVGGTVPSLSALGSTASLASLDAVQEFSIQTSTYAPEFGRQPGAQVQVVTRSGSNEFHGTAFNYLRNDKLDANNFFANANGLPRRPLRQNDFGFVLGGPVRKNRTFFFASYEGVRLRTPFVTDPLQVPSIEARGRATGVVRDLLNAFPLPTGPATDASAAPYLSSFSNPSRLDAGSVRMDRRVTDSQTIFFRFNESPSENLERARFCAASCVSVTSSATRTYTGGLTSTWTPSLTTDLRFNYSRSQTGLTYFMDTFGGAVVPPQSSLYPSFTNGAKGYIYIEVDPSGNNTLSDGLFVDNRNRQQNYVGGVAWNRGSHSIRLGADYRRLAPRSDSGSYRRQFRFPNVASLATGVAPAATLFAPEFVMEPRYVNYSAFAQDTWRLKPGLTLTYGFRYEIVPAPGEANGNFPATVRGFDRPQLAPAGTRFYDTSYNNVAPRLGVAWQPWRDRPLIIRAGSGLFYDLGYGFTGVTFSTSLFPYARSVNLTNVAYTAPAAAAQPPAVNRNPPYPRVFGYDTEYDLPWSLQQSVAVEYGLTPASSVTLSYVGALGRNLPRLESLRNLSPAFPRIDAVRNNGDSAYHSLQAQYQRRMSKGVQAIASYTFGKSLDTASEESLNNFQAPSSRLDPANDRGPSSFDVRHAFNTAVAWDLPAWLKGLSVDGILRTRTSTPVNVLTGRDPFGFGFATVSRPDVVPGQPLYLDDASQPGGRRFNPAAFDGNAPAAQGRQGTLGRNVLRGWGMSQVDLSVRRHFRLTERLGLQFRADGFNVLNQANFANPNGTLTSRVFGRATQMLGTGLGGLNPLFQVGGPRSFQLALKLMF